jgi:hypothetical protein
MRVHIGPHNHWFKPCSWVKRALAWWYEKNNKNNAVNAYETAIEVARKWFWWLQRIENWVDARTTRKISVRIDSYDVWNAEHTLALIILPTLEVLRTVGSSSPLIEDADVPEELRAKEKPGPGGAWENAEKKWAWVLDEMIWSFQQIVDESSDDKFFTHYDEPDPQEDSIFPHRIDFDENGYRDWEARKRRGLVLFGKYYEALWD